LLREEEISRLKRKVGELTMDLDILRVAACASKSHQSLFGSGIYKAKKGGLKYTLMHNLLIAEGEAPESDHGEEMDLLSPEARFDAKLGSLLSAGGS
jgi:hypothetical protein